MTPAQKWGRFLLRRIRARGLLLSDVALAVGTQPSAMSEWCRGRKMPQAYYAEAIADAVGDERLWSYWKMLRTKQCGLCGVDFLDLGRNGKARYCSEAHAKLGVKRAARQARGNAYKLDRAALSVHREAVAAYCGDCEPAGICRTPECPLRRVSPLPLSTRSIHPEAVQPRASAKMLSYVKRRDVA